jgi:NAD(P)-dependent dehydrogenase (short-subunit alcohol dehydrogenase family)
LNDSNLEGRRVLVVGASGGIGRATSNALAREGARVALAARRPEMLAEAVDAAGSRCVGIECDVRDPTDCSRVVERAVDELGGLDALVYTPGITLMLRIEDADAEAWRSTFNTNVIGAALVTRAALPALLESRGKVVFISSIAIDDQPPRIGLAPYIASKVALESMARAWQGEHPTIGFTTIAVGDTATEKIIETSPAIAQEFVPKWSAAGLLAGRMMNADSVADQIVHVLASLENVPRLAVTPVPPDNPEAVNIPGIKSTST